MITLCGSSYWWSSEALKTRCDQDKGHTGRHTEVRGLTLYKWSEDDVSRQRKYEEERDARFKLRTPPISAKD